MKLITNIREGWKHAQDQKRFSQLGTYCATSDNGDRIHLTYIPSGIYVLETSKNDVFHFHATGSTYWDKIPPHRGVHLQIHIGPRGTLQADLSLVRLIGLEDAIDSTPLYKEFNSEKSGLSDYRAAHNLFGSRNNYPRELDAMQNQDGSLRKATVEEIASKFNPPINCYLWEQGNDCIHTVGGGMLKDAIKNEVEEQMKNNGYVDSAANIFVSAAIRDDVGQIGYMLSALPHSLIGASQERFDTQHRQTMEKIIKFIERFRYDGLSNSMDSGEHNHYIKIMTEKLQKLIPSTQIGK